MRMFGMVVAVVMVAGAALYVGGYFNGDVDVRMTKKGRTAVNEGLEHTRKGVNKGLENLKIDRAPHVKVSKGE